MNAYGNLLFVALTRARLSRADGMVYPVGLCLALVMGLVALPSKLGSIVDVPRPIDVLPITTFETLVMAASCGVVVRQPELKVWDREDLQEEAHFRRRIPS